MKEKEDVNEKDVILTARVSPALHRKAKTKLIAQRESFQRVIVAAIERYAEGSADAGISARNGPDALELIAALLQKKSEGSVTEGSGKAVLLKRYLQEIREILLEMDRVLGQNASGGPIAALGIMQTPDTTLECGSIQAGTSERETDYSERAREVESHAERVDREARAVIEDARRLTGGGQRPPQPRKFPRKKAG